MSSFKRRPTEVRRQQIIEDARRILANHGMDGLTTRSLARAAGVTEGALYRHFRSKRDIVLGLIDEIEEALFAEIARAKGAGATPLESLEGILRERLSYAERRGGVSFIVIAEVLRSSDRGLRQRMRQVIDRYIETIEGLLEEGVRQGEVDSGINSNAAAVAFFGLVQGVVTLWQIASREMPLTSRHESLWDVYTRGIQPRQPTPLLASSRIAVGHAR